MAPVKGAPYGAPKQVRASTNYLHASRFFLLCSCSGSNRADSQRSFPSSKCEHGTGNTNQAPNTEHEARRQKRERYRRLGSAERAVGLRARAWRTEHRQVAIVIVGSRQCLQQSLHHGHVTAGRGRKGRLHVVIARDDRRVVLPHQGFDFGARLRLPPQARHPPTTPGLEFISRTCGGQVGARW